MNLFEHLKDSIEQLEYHKKKIEHLNTEIDYLCAEHNIDREELTKIVMEILNDEN